MFPQGSPFYARVIDKREVTRLQGMHDHPEIDGLHYPPTVIQVHSTDHPLMKGENFGPVLPVLSFETISDAINIINHYPKPLAVYAFTSNSSIKEQFVSNTSSGSVVFNDVMMQMSNPNFPFGGVGNSGMGGKYRGRASFEAFSNQKIVLNKTCFLDIPFRYPPFSNLAQRILLFALKLKWKYIFTGLLFLMVYLFMRYMIPFSYVGFYLLPPT